MAEPLRATFFTLKPRNRMVLLPATLVLLVLLAVIIGVFVAFNWAFFEQIIAMVRSGGVSGDELSEEQAATMGFGVLALVFSGMLFLFPLYIAIAAYEAACLRWMIRGEVPGLFGFNLDHDTWRVYGIYWCWLIAQFAVSMVASVIMAPVMLMMMGDILASGTEPGGEEMMALQLRMQSLSLLQYIPLAFLGIRLGPAAATSIARKRFSFFDAWVVTRERFWALFGSFAILALIVAAIWVAAAVYSLFVMYGGSWEEYVGDWSMIITSPEEAEARVQEVFDRFAMPDVWMHLAIGYAIMLAGSLFWALMSYGINARAALAALDEGKISVYAGDD